jgi:hypothetical protein
MIGVQSSGSWNSTEDFLHRMQSRSYLEVVKPYAALGVDALRKATPERSGKTSEHWSYEIVQRPGYISIKWTNDDVVEPGHIPVAVLIQYGHGTREGGYVEGIDYINPAMRPIFEQITAAVWREVTR